MNFETLLDSSLRARNTLIVLVTNEEERALASIRTWCEANRRGCLSWDAGDYFTWVTTPSAAAPAARDPLSALEQIEKFEPESGLVFILKDFHDSWTNSTVRRKLRSLAQRLKTTRKSIVITTHQSRLPEELRDEAVILINPLPGESELGGALDRLISSPGIRSELTSLGREKLARAALGLTLSQAVRAFSMSVIRGQGLLDERAIDWVTQEKQKILMEVEALEYTTAEQTALDVGGLSELKHWLALREMAFSQKARDYGLPVPRGIALIGIPGTGKSLTAKMIAGQWRIPLIRLDVGALFGSLVGQSEERTRRALHLAETVAPCVLWIDEMEKALAHGGLDSGTSTRVFGSILTWMQEKTAPCFVVATANDISSLPPELLRRGRFDEIFFLDLPNLKERIEIFNVHIARRKRLPSDYDVPALAAMTEGYVGAEIEQSIIDAMLVGFNDNGREFTTADIMAAIRRQVPLAISQRETIDYLRSWLREGRAQSASSPACCPQAGQFDMLWQSGYNNDPM